VKSSSPETGEMSIAVEDLHSGRKIVLIARGAKGSGDHSAGDPHPVLALLELETDSQSITMTGGAGHRVKERVGNTRLLCTGMINVIPMEWRPVVGRRILLARKQ
jgi:hypothetical protein